MKQKLIHIFALALVAAQIFVLTGCSSGNPEDAVSVESVASITGLGSVGMASRFGGVVVAGNTEEISRDQSMTVSEIKVEIGQDVKVGDVLFTYDNEVLLLNIEQKKLEIESMNNTVKANRKQIEELEKERDGVSDSDKLQYTLEIQSLEASNRETEYNISMAEKELARQEQASTDTSVRAGINGRVATINKDGGYDNFGNEKPFMTITEMTNLRVQGTVNEMNRASLTEGQPLTILSRTDGSTWAGFLEYIDWENPVSNNSYYYMDDSMASSSSYYFYVTLDSADGLIMGQHVYIDTGASDPGESAAIVLPSYYICDVDSDPYVWASNKDKLEKRKVTLGVYNLDMEAYEITDGVTVDDYIAFPDDSLKVGAPTVKFEGYSEDPYSGDMSMAPDGGGFAPAVVDMAVDGAMYAVAEDEVLY